MDLCKPMCMSMCMPMYRSVIRCVAKGLFAAAQQTSTSATQPKRHIPDCLRLMSVSQRVS